MAFKRDHILLEETNQWVCRELEKHWNLKAGSVEVSRLPAEIERPVPIPRPKPDSSVKRVPIV